MSKQNTQVATFALPVNGQESSDGNKLLKKYLFHWPLFVVGVILAMVGAYFYMKIAKPVYPILATLEFKAPTSAQGSVVTKDGDQQQLDPISTPVIVENEIEVMQSKKLMYEVVMKLELWVNYTKIDGRSKTELYNESPVKFAFVKAGSNVSGQATTLTVRIKDPNSFTLLDKDNGDKDYGFGKPIKSGLGTWKLDPAADLGAHIGSTIDIKVQDPDLVADSYQANVKVVLENKDAPFVNLSTSDPIPERGKDVLNSLMDLYMEDAMLSKNKDAQSTLTFITLRLDSLVKELTVVEREIEQYKSAQGMTDVVAQGVGFRDIRMANTKALNEVDIQLKIIADMERSLNSPNGVEKMPAASSKLGDNSLMDLYDQIAALEVKKSELAATVPAGNPMFTPINNQISTLRRTFNEKVQGIKSSLMANKLQLRSFDTGIEGSLKKLPEQDRMYNALKRNQESKERIYTFLLEKREQVALRYASSVSDAEVVDDAHAGKAKWPKASIVYALAFLLGLAAPAGLLYAREAMNERITHRRQIEDAVSVPILGELSFQDAKTPIVVTQGRGKFAIGEQFRVLRTNLYHLHNTTESGRVTLFTSSIGSEGKSFVSSNLAVTLAYASRKTIILEMDLRKPKVSGIFGLSSDHPGISDYLAETATDITKLIQPTGIPGLDMMGCGPILPNPSELLEKNKLDELIATLRKMYDDVIIDSPPIHLVTDALIISRVADASLYIIRQGHTLKEELEFINETDKANRFPKFSLVFNGIKRDNFGYGYGYGYGYYNSYNTYTDKEKETFGSVAKGFLKRF